MTVSEVETECPLGIIHGNANRNLNALRAMSHNMQAKNTSGTVTATASHGFENLETATRRNA